jgi:hypothetical protein
MIKMLNEGNQIHNFISRSGSGTVINYGFGSEFLTSSGSGSTSKKVMAPTVLVPVPVPVPQRCLGGKISISEGGGGGNKYRFLPKYIDPCVHENISGACSGWRRGEVIG